MAKRLKQTTLLTNGATFIRWRREQLGWSGERLADACRMFAASHDPPLEPDPPFDRPLISKIENRFRHLGADDVYILAGALGVSIVAMLTNNTEGITPETPPGVLVDEPIAAIRETHMRLDDLGQQVGLILGQLGLGGVAPGLSQAE